MRKRKSLKTAAWDYRMRREYSDQHNPCLRSCALVVEQAFMAGAAWQRKRTAQGKSEGT